VKLQYPLFFGWNKAYEGYIYRLCIVRCVDLTLHVLSPLHILLSARYNLCCA
jgi:hypothetical protein